MNYQTVGIDPGKKGGVVMIDSILRAVTIYPLPLDGNGDWDVDMMCHLAMTFRAARATVGIEVVHAFPSSMGAGTTNFTTGYAYGLWLGALAGKGVGVIKVRSEDWRKEFRLQVKAPARASGAEKLQASRERKQVSLAYARANLWHPYVTPKGRDLDGEAEAAIIASYVQRVTNRPTMPQEARNAD
jgi:hypothetical protein